VWVDRAPTMGKSKFGLLKHGSGYLRVIFHAARVTKNKTRLTNS
jgi:hypothetical protein